VRIISLLASATEIVCALGSGEMLVGRSHECDNPDWVRRLPPCSQPAFDVSVSSQEIDAEVRRRIRSGEPLYHLNAKLIDELRPDLLITQEHCEVCAITPGDVERSGACAAKQLTLSASSLDDIFQSILRISQAIGLPDEGKAVVQREKERLNRVKQESARSSRKTVVMLEWTDPLFAMGNWGPELVEIANGELLLGEKGEYSAAIPAEQLRDANPEYLIVAPCGFDLQRSLREQAVLERYPWWRELQAVRNGNVAFADGNLFFNRKSSLKFFTATPSAKPTKENIGCGSNRMRRRTRNRRPQVERDESRLIVEQRQRQRLDFARVAETARHPGRGPDHHL
jgi:iron complex transport system substrate-binding protein